MKITELIKELEKAKNSVGDVEVCTDGYFGTITRIPRTFLRRQV